MDETRYRQQLEGIKKYADIAEVPPAIAKAFTIQNASLIQLILACRLEFGCCSLDTNPNARHD
jgi:hypothetical protein